MNLNTEDPQIDVVALDEKYTYVFNHGRVSILRHGEAWIDDPEAPKAWIAVGCVIEELRAKVAKLEAQVDAARAVSSSGDPNEEWDIAHDAGVREVQEAIDNAGK